MSTVLVQAGQCGNQLGFETLDTLYRNLAGGDDVSVDHEMDMSVFFRSSSAGVPVARAVLVDTEPKVVDGVCVKAQQGPWRYNRRGCVVQQSGAGNNWAMGYNMCSGQFLEDTMDKVRREIEACDMLGGILLTQSLGGGTGSGFGTRLSQYLAAEYPSAVLCCLVSPYHFGEVIVQHYNSLMTLAYASQEASCAVFDNELAKQLCMKMMHVKNPTLNHINRAIANQLAAFLLPRLDKRDRRVFLSQDLSHLTPNQRYPFFDVRFTPQSPANAATFTHDSWEAIARTLHSMCVCDVVVERDLAAALRARTGRTTSLSAHDALPSVYNKSLAIQTIYRGPDSADAFQTSDALLSNPGLYCNFNTSPYQCHTSPRKAFGYSRVGAIASNSQAILPTLERTITKAADLYNVSAYVHSYTREGFEHHDFQHAFLGVGQFVVNYREL